ncbi:glycosyltransferase family 4 protein [Sanguibacter suaedae]|uniref:D-inositol 3-phosphate glycosyltransferase n=1 Tax=Sanguibacter suaedae TaxID=2795737 RepID=A0A934IE39_9MICO|nr:glycosyltransferase family 1 protein [Sanguibacter suaedae]MBI9116181.1 glycosyltransferase family 1 protein [Sanguibacter suaedae]
MRIAIVAESFLPSVNGVTGTVLRVLEHVEALRLTGVRHEVLVVAPEPQAATRSVAPPAGTSRDGSPGFVPDGVRVVRVPAVALPGYPDVRVAAGSPARLVRELRDFRPDVVHLASPFVLGARGARAAQALDVPCVAVYQTDVPAYAHRYSAPGLEPLLWSHVRRVHERAALTLAPSSAACAQLAAHRVPRVRRWGRGVDVAGFSPERRDAAWRAAVAPGGEVVVGYVGRLAPEKQVQDLAVLADVPGVRLVVVGDGPARGDLERLLPGAVFTGQLSGAALHSVMASLDVFVHTGELETFGQTLQEAHASGVPVVAPARGGPVDLVDPSRTGWLYAPGDLVGLRSHVVDLVGDARKRQAFGRAARAAVEGRTWARVCDELMGHYADVVAGVHLADVEPHGLHEHDGLPGVDDRAAQGRGERVDGAEV